MPAFSMFGVDTLGALTGTLILTLIILIVNSIAMRRKEKYSACKFLAFLLSFYNSI